MLMLGAPIWVPATDYGWSCLLGDMAAITASLTPLFCKRSLCKRSWASIYCTVTYYCVVYYWPWRHRCSFWISNCFFLSMMLRLRLLFESVLSPSLEDYAPTGELRPERGICIVEDPKPNCLSLPATPSGAICLVLLASRALLIQSAFSGDKWASESFDDFIGEVRVAAPSFANIPWRVSKGSNSPAV